MKFHENPSSGSRADTNRQINGRTWWSYLERKYGWQ